MSDDQNTTPNTPIPDSPQNLDSTAPDTPPKAQNAPGSDSDPVSLKDVNEPINEPNAPSENEGVSTNNPPVEPIPEPVQTPISAEQPQTAQIPGI